ncbi:uncharacterized protein RJT20DRAFT_133543 [Scheffersomyces xylosifermentans]|uniref:uncharacterized protein n=1 Tax=Scheffersomyces xylosifermentans TaxID=1304137 RepID=UPI00315DB3E2
MNKLNIRRGSDFMSVEYSYELSKCLQLSERCLVFPANTIFLNFSIAINGNCLYQNDYNSLIERMGSSIASAPYWNSLELEPHLLYHSNQNSFSLELSCKIFSSLKDQQNLDTTTGAERNTLENMCVTLNLFTQDKEISILNIVQDFNYLLSSWLVNMEYKFPLIFSFYGRQCFKINYKWLLKCTDEILDPQMTRILQLQRSINKLEVLTENLIKMQRRILAEYNIINNVLEMARSSHHYKMQMSSSSPEPSISDTNPEKF